jgi:hypothetical protein
LLVTKATGDFAEEGTALFEGRAPARGDQVRDEPYDDSYAFGFGDA